MGLIKSERTNSNQVEIWNNEYEVNLDKARFTFVTVTSSANPFFRRFFRSQELFAESAPKLDSLISRFYRNIDCAVEKAFRAETLYRGSNAFRQIRIETDLVKDRFDQLQLESSSQAVLSLWTPDQELPQQRQSIDIRVGRQFSSDGIRLLGMIGSDGRPLSDELKLVANELRRKGITRVMLRDDHIFSGQTVLELERMLKDGGVVVTGVVSLTQASTIERFKTVPLIRFRSGSSNSHSAIDLVEYDDFLLGAGGCRVALKNNETALIPYCLPFACPTQRASIPLAGSCEFSVQVLKANREFYETLSQLTGSNIRLIDSSPLFQNYGREELKVSGNQSMVQIISTALNRIRGGKAQLVSTVSNNDDSVLSDKQESKKQSQSSSTRRVRRELVLLDVNRTLIRAGEADIDPLILNDLRRVIDTLQTNGVELGLNSDSPAQGLQRIANKLGLKGLMIAENGNVIVNEKGETSILRSFSPAVLKRTKRFIDAFGTQFGASKKAEMFSVECGGSIPDTSTPWFAYGKGRVSSLSVFGSKDFISYLAQQNWRRIIGVASCIDTSIAASPYSVFIVQPYKDIRSGKRNACRRIARSGIRVVHIGDSASDLLGGKSMRCGLVGSTPLLETQIPPSAMRTNLGYAAGVVDLLEQIATLRSVYGRIIR